MMLPQLGDVQETLLIPLFMRACESRRRDAICRDPRALEIVDQLDYDFDKFKNWVVQLDVAIRTELFDLAVGRFLQRHPDGVVVNLGAGLDARFDRLDNGRVLWFDLDLPDSIELRRQFFRESPRQRFIADSLTETTWLATVEELRGERPVMLMAEAVFFYLEEQEVRASLDRIAKQWPGAEILFQSLSPTYVGRQHIISPIRATNAEFKWGVASGSEVAAWDDDYELIDEWSFIDRHRRRWSHYRLWTALLPWVRRRVRQIMKISHLRLGLPEHAEVQPAIPREPLVNANAR